MKIVEKREFLARVVRAKVELEAIGSDLWQSIEYTTGTERAEGITKLRLPDELKAIALDNDLAGEGSAAEEEDQLGKLLERIRA